MEAIGKKLVGPILGLIGSSLLIIAVFIVPIINPFFDIFIPLVPVLVTGVLGLIGAILGLVGKRTRGAELMLGAGIGGIMFVGGLNLITLMFPPYGAPDPLLLITLIFPVLELLGGILGPKKKKSQTLI